MTIGILRLVLFIQDSNSLKEKRMALQSLRAKLRNNFNVALTQIDHQDKWQSAMLVIVGVERDRRNMDSLLSGVLNFVEKFNNMSIVDHEMELI